MFPFLVDANAIKEFQEERLSTETTAIQDAMDKLLSVGFIAVDENDGNPLIIDEWISCSSCKNSILNLRDWIDSLLQKGKLKLLPACKMLDLKKKLRLFGVPNKDQKYIILACCIEGHSIITNDIDLHDPKYKNAPSLTKDKIKRDKNGAVCKYIKKNYNINTISWPELDAALT